MLNSSLGFAAIALSAAAVGLSSLISTSPVQAAPLSEPAPHHQPAPLSAKPALAKSLTAQSGSVKATFSYDPLEGSSGLSSFMGKRARLTIERRGKLVYDRSEEEVPIPYAYQRSPFVLRDLDGDQEPELVIDYFSGGAHCCVVSAIYRFNPQRQAYEVMDLATSHIGYQLKDLDRDGKPEFVTADGRFAYQFASFAGSGFPLQLWSYRQGKFVDVTRSYPQLVRDSAYRSWKLIQQRRQSNPEGREIKGILAAYLADKYSLGESQEGWKNLRAWYKEGDRQVFFDQLQSFLKETGYTR